MKIDISDHISIVLIKDNITFDTDVKIVQEKLKSRFNITYSEKVIIAVLDDLYMCSLNEVGTVEYPEDY